MMRGQEPANPKFINTCFSLVAPDWGITVAGVYDVRSDVVTAIEGAGGTSPLGAPPEVRATEADYARVWYHTITGQIFG